VLSWGISVCCWCASDCHVCSSRLSSVLPQQHTEWRWWLNIGHAILWLHYIVWLGGVVIGRRISDREVASSIPGCFAARCNSGQVVHTRVPLFTKHYTLVPASAGVKCTTGAVLGMLAAIRWILRLAANQRHSSIVLTCGCHCTAALMWLLSLTPLYKLT